MSERFANTPEPPYYAVIFTNQLAKQADGYDAMAQKMLELAMQHPACLGAESTRDAAGLAITVSYWKDEAGIADWKADVRHLAAQKAGIERWYTQYELRVARVERAYSGPHGRSV